MNAIRKWIIENESRMEDNNKYRWIVSASFDVCVSEWIWVLIKKSVATNENGND